MDLKDFLNIKIQNHWINCISAILKWIKNIELLNELKTKTNFLSEDVKIIERIYCYLNNIEKIHLCQECWIKVDFIKFSKWYRKYCSVKCMCNNEKIKKKKDITNLLKYGVKNVRQSKIIKDKIKETNLLKYGFEYALQNTNIQNKIKETNMYKYWVEYPLQSKIIKDKIKKTNILKYGVEFPLQNKEIKNKIIISNLKQYGLQYPFGAKIIKDKIKKNNLLKYWVENIFQSKIVKDKIKKTNIEKYWVSCFINSNDFNSKTKKTILLKYWVENISILQSYKAVKKYNKIFKKNNVNIEYNNNLYICNCNICGIESIINRSILHNRSKYNITPCINCFPLDNQFSNIEKQFVEYIKSIYEWEVIENDRKILNGKEIDILLPELNIWIEIHGLYWHNDSKNTDKNYHYNKYQLAKEKWIHLYQFFDDEIPQSMMYIYSIIKNKNYLQSNINLDLLNEKYNLSIPINLIWNKTKYLSEELIIKKINLENNNDFNNFLEIYNIKWSIKSGYISENNKLNNLYNYWIYTKDDELLSVISFKNISENDNNIKYEIIRYNTFPWIDIIWWLKSFIDYFKKEIDIISLLENDLNKDKLSIEILYNSDLRYEVNFDFWINKELIENSFINLWESDIVYYDYINGKKYKNWEYINNKNILENDIKYQKIYNCWYINWILHL